MKKSVIKAAALIMAALVLCLALASCGKTLSGTYSMEAAGTGAEMEFNGSKVKITPKLLGVYGTSVEAKYEIKDDKITFTFEDSDKDSDAAKKYSGTFDFAEDKDAGTITIGQFGKFTKK